MPKKSQKKREADGTGVRLRAILAGTCNLPVGRHRPLQKSRWEAVLVMAAGCPPNTVLQAHNELR